MQIERIERSIGSCRRVGAVLSYGTLIIDSPEARVDGRQAACAWICGVFGEALAGVILFVREARGGDCRAQCRGGGVGAGRGTHK